MERAMGKGKMTDTTKRLLSALAVLIADYKERFDRGEKVNETALKYADAQFANAIENDKEILEILEKGGDFDITDGIKLRGTKPTEQPGVQIMSYESKPKEFNSVLESIASAIEENWNLHIEQIRQNGGRKVKN